MTDLYSQGWKMIIQPQQYSYEERDLGPDVLLIKGNTVHKLNFAINNKKGMTIRGSLFFIKETRDSAPCLVYCHSHNGNRCEGAELLSQIIPEFNLCVFDYTGSGHSDGEFCTLGIKEKDDLACVLDFLVDVYKVQNLFLWGRSMGAVTSLLYCDDYKSKHRIKGIVLDSPFDNAKEMICDLVSNHKPIPKFIVNLALIPIGITIKDKTGVDVLDINTKEIVKRLEIPAYFLVAKGDQVTDPEKVRKLHDDYKGDTKYFNLIGGFHHTGRVDSTIKEIKAFLLDLREDMTTVSKIYALEREKQGLVQTGEFSQSMEEGVAPNRPKLSGIRQIQKIKSSKIVRPKFFKKTGPVLSKNLKPKTLVQSFLGSVRDPANSIADLSFDHVYSQLSISKTSLRGNSSKISSYQSKIKVQRPPKPYLKNGPKIGKRLTLNQKNGKARKTLNLKMKRKEKR